ncbi:MAG: tetratricopeptide repeat protein [Planctomycetota bacterium]
MKTALLAATMAACLTGAAAGGTGTTAGDYEKRAYHAPSPRQRLELLDKALAINPNHVPSLTHRARVRLALGDKKLALADNVRAAELVPDDPFVNGVAAFYARELKQYDKAVRFYGRAVAIDRKNFALRARYIDALIKALKIDDALEHANFLVRHWPNDLRSYAIRANVYEWAGRHKDAVDDLTWLIKHSPNDPIHYASRCGDYRSLGDGERALADAQASLRLGRRTSGAYAAIGCSYEVLGQLERALRAYAKAADNDDQKEYYKIWSCIILRKLGRRQDADKLIKEFLKNFGQDKWIAPVIKYLAGEMTEAEVIRLAKHEEPETNRQQFCEAYYYIGACYLADKDLDKAEEFMKKCLEQRVVDFYENGFAIRDLRTIKKLREEAAKKDKPPK